MRGRRTATLWLAAGLLGGACGGGTDPGDGGSSSNDAGGMDGGARDGAAPPRDSAPQGYDSGAAPACAVPSLVQTVAERPGGSTMADPVGLVRASGGWLTAVRRTEAPALADGGVDGGAAEGGLDASAEGGAEAAVRDGGAGRYVTDRVELLALGDDGRSRGPARVLYDASGSGFELSAPALAAVRGGAAVLFEESRGQASRPDFVLHLRYAQVDASTLAGDSRALRERYTRPTLDGLASGGTLGVSAVVDQATDSGLVTVRPVALALAPDGSGRVAADADLLFTLPYDVQDPRMRALATGGAVYAYRSEMHPSWVRFDDVGQAQRIRSVQELSLPALDDVGAVDDAVFFAWSRQVAGGTTEVHLVVLGTEDGRVRRNDLLESFTGLGPTSVTVAPAWGGMALFWRRGVDANAVLRVAVVRPDGATHLAPTDFARVPNLEGHPVAVLEGRAARLLVRDGYQANRWGFTFVQGCLPSP